jgi:hypothetical protein
VSRQALNEAISYIGRLTADRDFWKERLQVETRARIEAEALSRTGAVKVPSGEIEEIVSDLEYWSERLADMRQPQGQSSLKHAASILSALEPAAPERKTLVHEPMVWTGRGPYGMSPAAPEGQQEAAAWQSQDLIESVSYVSKNFGLVRYEGIDRYFGQSTHKFSTGHGARYVLPEALNDFLSPKPVARPAAQAVTDAGVEAAARHITKWLGFAWDDLHDGRVIEKGLPIFLHHSQFGWQFQGHKGDMIDLARIALKAAMEAGRHE